MRENYMRCIYVYVALHLSTCSSWARSCVFIQYSFFRDMDRWVRDAQESVRVQSEPSEERKDVRAARFTANISRSRALWRSRDFLDAFTARKVLGSSGGAAEFSCLWISSAQNCAFMCFFLTYFYFSFYTCNVCNDYVQQKNTFGHWTALH